MPELPYSFQNNHVPHQYVKDVINNSIGNVENIFVLKFKKKYKQVVVFAMYVHYMESIKL